MLRLSFTVFRRLNIVFSLRALLSVHWLAAVPTSVNPSSPVLSISDLSSAPHMISLSPSCIANVLVAWPWQPRPPPYSDRSVTVSHDQPDFKSHNIVLTILLFLSLAVCICVLQSLLCVCPPLLRVEHRWTPRTFHFQAFLLVCRQQSCREELDGLVLRCRNVWACHVEKFNKCSKPLVEVSICRLYITCIFPYLEFFCFTTTSRAAIPCVQRLEDIVIWYITTKFLILCCT